MRSTWTCVVAPILTELLLPYLLYVSADKTERNVVGMRVEKRALVATLRSTILKTKKKKKKEKNKEKKWVEEIRKSIRIEIKWLNFESGGFEFRRVESRELLWRFVSATDRLSMQANARPAKVSARHASKPRTEDRVPKVTPTTRSRNNHLAFLSSVLLHPRFVCSLARWFSRSLSVQRHILSFFSSYLLSFFLPSFLSTFYGRFTSLTVVSFFHWLAPVRAIQPTLYEKTLKSFFATGRASWLLLQQKPQ